MYKSTIHLGLTMSKIVNLYRCKYIKNLGILYNCAAGFHTRILYDLAGERMSDNYRTSNFRLKTTIYSFRSSNQIMSMTRI